MDFSALPKIELHLHLDCSLSYRVVKQLKPAVTEAEYRHDFIAPPKCIDLADYIHRASKSIELMQTQAALRLVTLDLLDQLAADRVVYAEIRFAPLEHTLQVLTPAAVVQAVTDAAQEGMRQTGIEAGIILCTLRHYTEAQSMETARLAKQFLGSGVVGFDIASDEAHFPIDNHIDAFQYARRHGIPCTAHAGEARGPDSVWETLQYFQPKRIGHGVRSIEDPALVAFLRENNIHLEVCPSSNIQTNVYATLADHPVDRLFGAGVPLNINTDGRTLSNTTLSREYQRLHEVFGWEKAEFLRCNLNAVEAAFAGEAVKRRLRKWFED